MAFFVVSCSGDKSFEAGIKGSESPYDKDHSINTMSTTFVASYDYIIDIADMIEAGESVSQTIEDDISNEVWHEGTITGIDINQTPKELKITLKTKKLDILDPREVEILQKAIESESVQNEVIRLTVPLPVSGIEPGDTLSVITQGTEQAETKFTGSMKVEKISYSGSVNGFSMTIEGTAING